LLPFTFTTSFFCTKIYNQLNIIRNDIDELNALLQLELTTDDYLPQVNDSLKKIRKQAQMKGFRPGMVPIGLVKRMYGTRVMVEEIEKVVGKGLQDYIKENELRILFNPLMVPDKKVEFSATEPTDFTFNYEIGLAPQFELNYKEDTLTKYTIEMSEDFIQDELDRLRRRLGVENETTPPIEEKDILEVRLEELKEDGLVKEEGVTNQSMIAVDLIKDTDIQAQVMQLELDGKLNINLKKAFDRTEEELLKFLLDKKDEEAEGLGMDYQLTLLGIKRTELADMTPEFFEQVYGDKTFDTEEKFMERFRQDFTELSEARSDEQFKSDIYKHLLDTIQMDLPEDFLKKSIKQNSESLSDEKLEEEFPNYLKSIKWELIRNKIANENELKVEQTDIQEQAIEDVSRTYQQYMNVQISYEEAKGYSAGMLKDQKYLEEAYGKILERKLFDHLTTEVKSEAKPISFEDFIKLN